MRVAQVHDDAVCCEKHCYDKIGHGTISSRRRHRYRSMPGLPCQWRDRCARGPSWQWVRGKQEERGVLDLEFVYRILFSASIEFKTHCTPLYSGSTACYLPYSMVDCNVSLHENMSLVQYSFENVQPVRHLLINMLSATDLSTFCYAVGIDLTEWERNRYLKPIRDLVEQEN
jgi:hypothetical protein